MMLQIAICDDETAQLSLLEMLVRKWAKEKRIPVQVAACRNADQFFFLWEEKKDTNILLLDIDMPGMDGMSLARKLREKGERLQILFITGVADQALLGYEVEAVSYLLKPVKEEKLFSGLDRAWEHCEMAEPELVVEMAGEIARVRIRDIRYLESAAHDTIVWLDKAGEGLKSRVGIQKLEEALQKEEGLFFRLHRSYLVNLAHVDRITRKEVLLDTGVSIPVARGKWEELNRAWLRYYRKKEDEERMGEEK